MVFGLYQQASLKRFADIRRLSIRLTKDLFEVEIEIFRCQTRIERILTDATWRQVALAETFLELFYAAPFRSYSGTLEPNEAREEDMQESNNGRKEHYILALADGTCVLVREIRSEDASALQRLFDRLSERSSYLRYFGSMKELSDRQARHFAEVDGVDRCALVALDPEDDAEIVAVVRYEREGSTDRAEYAALVEDRWQGLGLGLGLTRALIQTARQRGIRDFEALVLPENRGMFRLLRSLELPERVRWEEGVKHFSIDLFPEQAAEELKSR